MELSTLQTIFTADDRDLRRKLMAADKAGESTARSLQSRFNNLKLRIPGIKPPAMPSMPSMGGGGGAGGSAPGGGGGSGDLMGGIKSIAGGNLISGAITGGVTALGGAMKEGWSAGIQYNSMLENANVRLKRFFATGQETSKFVSQIEKFAADSPVFQLDEAMMGTQRLLDMKYAAHEVIPALEDIGNAVGGIGGNTETIDRLTLTFQQMAGKGQVYAEEMQQLVEAGLPAWELLAKAIGKTEKETRKLVEQGRVRGGAAKGIIAMAGEKFAGQSEAAGKTFSGLQSQLESAAQQAAGKATKGNFDQYKQAMTAGLQGLGTQAAAEAAAELDKLLTDIGKKFDPALQEFAKGRYFESMRDSINNGRQAAYNFEQGNFQQGMNNAGQAVGSAVGMQRGARGEEQTASNIVGKMDDIDKKVAAPVVKGVTAMIESRVAQTTLDFFSTAMSAIGIDTGRKAQELGTAAGTSLGTGLESSKAAVQASGASVGKQAEQGVRDSLEQNSPSQVMIRLGMGAGESFADGFEQGKKKIQPITQDDLYKKFGEKAEEVKKSMQAAVGKPGADKLAKKGIGFAPGYFTSGNQETDTAIQSQSKRTGVPADLLFAQQLRESRFDPNAKSYVGALGPAQFMPATAKRFGLEDPTDRTDATRAQADYMGFMLKKFGKFGNKEELALAGYNAGENRKTLEAGRVPAIAETQGYIKEITSVIAQIRSSGDIAAKAAPSVDSLSAAIDAAKQKISEFAASLPTFGEAIDKIKKSVLSVATQPGQAARGAASVAARTVEPISPATAQRITNGANAVANSLDAAAKRVQGVGAGQPAGVGVTVRAGASRVSVSPSSVVGGVPLPSSLPSFQDANMKAAQLAKQALTDMTNAAKGIPAPTMAATLAMKESGSQAGKWATEIDAATSKFGTAGERFESFKERLGQGFDDAIAALATGGARWQDVAKQIGVDFFNSLAQEMMLKATGGEHGSIGGMLGGLVSGLFGGLFKAQGGPVKKDQPYIVGEKGPELFRPDRSGTIIPNNQLRQNGFSSANLANRFGMMPSYAGGQPGAGMATYSPINNPSTTVNRFSVGPVGSAPSGGAGMTTYSPINSPGNTVNRFSVSAVGSAPTGGGMGMASYQSFNKTDKRSQAIYNAFGVSGVKPGRAADGAMIRGEGTSRSDSVPMWLSNGEYVNDARTVERLGPKFFRALPEMARTGVIQQLMEQKEQTRGYRGRQAMMAGRMADGGLVIGSGAGSTSSNSPSAVHMPPALPTQRAQGQASGEGGKMITNNITINVPINAPNGNVSRQTQQQLATQTGQAVQMALSRNS